jgi:hypothetical protein
MASRPDPQRPSLTGLPRSLAYWATAVTVSLYVALTSGFRGEIRLIDGWEHHRVVRVMAQLGFAAGNPTYASDEPSIRYSPYSAILALAARWGHWDPWDVLTVAAVLNTALLFVALYALLAAFDRTSIAFPTAITMLFLYGATPGYANTLALEDLPVHQGNPSAFALALCLLCWAGWVWASRSSRARLLWAGAAIAGAVAVATLSHGMSGTLALVGLVGASLASARPRQMLLGTAIVSALAVALCAAWPYYPFLRAVLHNPNPEYWYNPAILKLMLTSWCLPAMVAAVLAFPYRDDPLVRFGIVGLVATVLLTGVALATRSAAFARLPLAGLVFAQLLVGYAIAQWKVCSPSTWREVRAGLGARAGDVFAGAFVRVAVPLAIVFFGVPQLLSIARAPHLMRPYLASWLHLADKRSHLRAHYRDVLTPVAERDVVMADSGTGWPVPSFHGRVVGAEHFEFFTPGQQRRFDDAQSFMRAGTPTADRIRLLETYAARWILLDRVADEHVLPELLIPEAIVRQSGDLVLMDAERWRARASPVTVAH